MICSLKSILVATLLAMNVIFSVNAMHDKISHDLFGQNDLVDCFDRVRKPVVNSFRSERDLLYEDARVYCAEVTRALEKVIKEEVEPLFQDINSVFAGKAYVDEYGLLSLIDDKGYYMIFKDGHFIRKRKNANNNEGRVIFSMIKNVASNEFIHKWFIVTWNGVRVPSVIEQDIINNYLGVRWAEQELQNKIRVVDSNFRNAAKTLQKAICRTIEPVFSFLVNDRTYFLHGLLCIENPRKMMHFVDNAIVVAENNIGRIDVQILPTNEQINIFERFKYICDGKDATLLQKTIICSWANGVAIKNGVVVSADILPFV